MKAQTRLQKRVAILRDALAQIRIRQIIPTSGTYFCSNENGPINKETLTAGVKPCRVCWLGAAFLGSVRLFNEYDATGHISHYDMRMNLKRFFSDKEQVILENLFEGFYDEANPVKKTLQAFLRLPASVRLTYICNSVIRAGGVVDQAKLEKNAARYGQRKAKERLTKK